MEQITLRIPSDTLEEAEAEAEEQGVSRAEILRGAIESRDESREEVRELRDRVDELEQKAERLEREKRLILEDREEKQELVAFAEAERDVVERREQRERERESAGVVTRAKWWLVGRDVDESEN